MRIVVIGGTGHVGSFLVPRLVRAGHDREAEDADGSFAGRVADLGPEAVIDMVCFTEASARALVEGLRGRTGHLVHCGSIWRHGISLKVPVTEDHGTPPFGDYGVQKAAIAELLRAETAAGGLVTTSLHPGHISGPGWPVVNPVGNLDPTVWQRLAAGEELTIPGLGTDLMNHVHADDVAQAFALAVEHRQEAAGEDFNVVAASALNVRGFASIAAGWFGRDPQLRSVSWEEFRAGTSPDFADSSWQHLYRSQCMSIDKARRLLGYAPRFEPEEAAYEAVRWLIEQGELAVAAELVQPSAPDPVPR
jgi:nucleoside-diphosphate-sugar epimerase